MEEINNNMDVEIMKIPCPKGLEGRVIKAEIMEKNGTILVYAHKKAENVCKGVLVVNTKRVSICLNNADILYIEPFEGGVNIITKGGTEWHDIRMKALKELLDKTYFLNIRNNRIVNETAIKKYEYDRVKMIDDTEIAVGNTYKKECYARLKYLM